MFLIVLKHIFLALNTIALY